VHRLEAGEAAADDLAQLVADDKCSVRAVRQAGKPNRLLLTDAQAQLLRNVRH